MGQPKQISYIDVSLLIKDEADKLYVELQCAKYKLDLHQVISPPLTLTALGEYATQMDRICTKPNYSSDTLWLRKIGGQLWAVLFPDSWQDQIRPIMKECQQSAHGLRINIHADGIIAKSTPWELLYDGSNQRFLGNSPKYIIVRTPTIMRRLQKRKIDTNGGPLRIIAASASPPRQTAIHWDLDPQAIVTSLAKLPKQKYDFKSFPRLSSQEFLHVLREKQPHILHLVAHGSEAGVCFEDEKTMEYQNLYEQLQTIPSLRIIIFSVCDSSQILGHKDFFDLPLNLPSPDGIWAVIVMRTIISSVAAAHFTQSLYSALTDRQSLSYAVGQARAELATSNEQESLQWSVPMIHQAYDVLPFPPLTTTPAWAKSQPFSRSEIEEAWKLIDSALEELWNIKCVLNLPTVSPNILRAVNVNIEQGAVREAQSYLLRMRYPARMTRWMSTARNLIHNIQQNYDDCLQIIVQLKSSTIQDQKYRDNLELACQFANEAYQLGEELINHIEKLFKQP